jgi:hypothetical protein
VGSLVFGDLAFIIACVSVLPFGCAIRPSQSRQSLSGSMLARSWKYAFPMLIMVSLIIEKVSHATDISQLLTKNLFLFLLHLEKMKTAKSQKRNGHFYA